jgi:hypothetical protein
MNDAKVLLENPEVLQAIERGQILADERGILNAYEICRLCVTQLEQIGWTADYDLSGELFDLEKL